MIFIYEPQHLIPHNCLEDYKTCYAMKDATYQFEFLIQLDKDIIEEIDKIYFVHPKDLTVKIYENTFSNYYPEINKYNDKEIIKKIFELTLLPRQVDKNDDEKYRKIISLIHSQKMVEESSNSLSEICAKENGKILIYLPYKKEKTEMILTNAKDHNIRLYTNTINMKVRTGAKVVQVDPKLYKKISNNLNKIRTQVQIDNPVAAYYYRPKSLLDVFENSLLKQINLIKRDENKRLNITGEERLLAISCISHILSSYTPNYYYLAEGIPSVVYKDAPAVFLNFDSVKDSEDEKKLYKLTKKIGFDQHIILQSFHDKYSEYFNNYEKINLPNRDDLSRFLSELFFALLDAKTKITDDYHKLYSLLSYNIFVDILNKTPKLDHIEQVISSIEKLTPEDLFHNVDLWYFINAELDRLEKNLKTNMDYKVKKRVRFEFNGNDWEISGLTKKTIIVRDLNGIKHIVLIILYHQYFNKEIDVTKLRYLTSKIENPSLEEKTDSVDLEADRNSVSEALIVAKRDLSISDFCKNYIKYGKYNYSVKHSNEIECEVIHPILEPSFFK